MALTQFWQTLIGMSAIASALGVSCYAACRFLRPHPGLGLFLTAFLALFSLLIGFSFLLVFPVWCLCSRCGVELHRKTREDDYECSQGIIFTATASTLLLGLYGGVGYLSNMSFYAPQEQAAVAIGKVYLTLLAVTPSLAPLLWMHHSNKGLTEIPEHQGDKQ